MNDRVGLVHSGSLLPAQVSGCTATYSDCINSAFEGDSINNPKESETYCPPTIGVNRTKGIVWVLGVDWIRERLRMLGTNPKWLEKCCLVLGLMLERTVDRRRDFIPVSSSYLREVLGDESRRYIMPLLERIGAIERSKSEGKWYQRTTQKYRLTPSYCRLPLGYLKLSASLFRRHIEKRRKRLERAIRASPVHEVLWADMQLLSLHPAYEAAIPSFTEGERMKRWAWERVISEILHKDFVFSCPEGKPRSMPGRIYTTFTSTPKALRKFALLEGRPVVEIDVKCSQPFLHSILISDPEEKKRYLHSVLSGTFYEDIGKASGLDWKNRDALKEKIFASVFYGRTRPVEKDPIWAAFSRLYPTLAAAIASKKRLRYQDLAIEMQDLEARIILQTAVPAIKLHEPNAKILTLHDAIYVHPEHCELAKDCLLAAFEQFTGYSPSLRVEPHAASQELTASSGSKL